MTEAGSSQRCAPQREQLRDSPVEEDIDEDEQVVGDGDGEEIGTGPAQGEKLRANGKAAEP